MPELGDAVERNVLELLLSHVRLARLERSGLHAVPVNVQIAVVRERVIESMPDSARARRVAELREHVAVGRLVDVISVGRAVRELDLRGPQVEAAAVLCRQHSLVDADRDHRVNPLADVESRGREAIWIAGAGLAEPVGSSAAGVAILEEGGHVEVNERHYARTSLPTQLRRGRQRQRGSGDARRDERRERGCGRAAHSWQPPELTRGRLR